MESAQAREDRKKRVRSYFVSFACSTKDLPSTLTTERGQTSCQTTSSSSPAPVKYNCSFNTSFNSHRTASTTSYSTTGWHAETRSGYTPAWINNGECSFCGKTNYHCSQTGFNDTQTGIFCAETCHPNSGTGRNAGDYKESHSDGSRPTQRKEKRKRGQRVGGERCSCEWKCYARCHECLRERQYEQRFERCAAAEAICFCCVECEGGYWKYSTEAN